MRSRVRSGQGIIGETQLEGYGVAGGWLCGTENETASFVMYSWGKGEDQGWS